MLAKDRCIIYFIITINDNKNIGKFADFQNAAYLENWWKTLSNLIQILFKAVDNRTVTMNDMYQTSIEH